MQYIWYFAESSNRNTTFSRSLSFPTVNSQTASKSLSFSWVLMSLKEHQLYRGNTIQYHLFSFLLQILSWEYEAGRFLHSEYWDHLVLVGVVLNPHIIFFLFLFQIWFFFLVWNSLKLSLTRLSMIVTLAFEWLDEAKVKAFRNRV